jgi:chromosome segregation ATPase
MENFLPELTIANIIAFGINAYLFWKRGGQTVTRDLIDLQNNQINLQKGQIGILQDEVKTGDQRRHELGNKLQSITLEVGMLKGQMQEKDSKIEEYTKIFQGRDPQILEVLSEIRDFMKNLDARVTPAKGGASAA